MSAEYREGEILDITIRARVVEMVPGGALRFTFRQAEHLRAAPYPMVIALHSPDLTITRVAPPEWPAQPGDLWRSTPTQWAPHGALWLAGEDSSDSTSDPHMSMYCADGRTLDADELLRSHPGLTLVHREPEVDRG